MSIKQQCQVWIKDVLSCDAWKVYHSNSAKLLGQKSVAVCEIAPATHSLLSKQLIHSIIQLRVSSKLRFTAHSVVVAPIKCGTLHCGTVCSTPLTVLFSIVETLKGTVHTTVNIYVVTTTTWWLGSALAWPVTVFDRIWSPVFLATCNVAQCI